MIYHLITLDLETSKAYMLVNEHNIVLSDWMPSIRLCFDYAKPASTTTLKQTTLDSYYNNLYTPVIQFELDNCSYEEFHARFPELFI